MTQTLCLSGAVILKAGINATTLTETQYDLIINEAESFVNVSTCRDWVTDYASLPANTKKILEDAASSFAAIKLINYDMSGYTSRFEAQVCLNVNWAVFRECVNLLRDNEMKTFVETGTND